MLPCPDLVVDDAVVIVLLVHLQSIDAQHEFRRHRVAEGALGAAGKMPGLPALAAGRFAISDREGAVLASRVLQQDRVGLIVVPEVRIAAPVLIAYLLGPDQPFMMQDARSPAGDLWRGCPSPSRGRMS